VSDGTVRIELATAAELGPLYSTETDVVARVRRNAILADSVAKGGCYLVRAADARIAGYITWDFGFFNRPFVRLLAVDPAYRRIGFGAALLARVEETAAPYGELFVSTEERNAPMRALLARAAYDAAGAIDRLNEPGNLELVYHKRLET
jgi:GNAT superfamily N-acetyltransferase